MRKKWKQNEWGRRVGILMLAIALTASMFAAAPAASAEPTAGQVDITGLIIEGIETETIIDSAAGTVRFHIPNGSVRTNLTPVITVSEGASISLPADQPVDFTTPVNVTVTASDGVTTKQWMLFCGIELIEPNELSEVDSVFSNDKYYFETQKNVSGETYADLAQVAVEGMPFGEAVEITTKARPPHIYNVQLSKRLQMEVALGDTYYAEFYMRTITTADETGTGQTKFAFEDVPGNYKKSTDDPFSVQKNDGWEKFVKAFPILHPNGPNDARIVFNFGYSPQQVQIGGIRVINYGTVTDEERKRLPALQYTYEGREADAAWRAEALERIEQIRKSKLEIQVVDGSGKPMSGIPVQVEMKKHEFLFGTQTNQYRFNSPPYQQQQLKDNLKTYFNTAIAGYETLWNDWEATESNKSTVKRQESAKLHNWLRENGLSVNAGHILWFIEDELVDDFSGLKAHPALLERRIKSHLVEQANNLKGQVEEWNVVNELINYHSALDIAGKDQLIDWFNLVREIDPDAKLVMNEASISPGGGNLDAFLQNYVNYVREGGGELDTIGYQSHIGTKPHSIVKYKEMLDKLGENGEVSITEYDLNTLDEELQADYTRDLLILAYSHPKVSSFTMWGMYDPWHWRQNSPMFKGVPDPNDPTNPALRTWVLKPSGEEYKKLVMEAWRTNESGVTDAEGRFAVRGFHGDYEVTVNGIPYRTTLSSGGRELIIHADRPASGDTSLKSLAYKGVPVDGFDPNRLTYHVQIPLSAGKNGISGISAEANDPNATVAIKHPANWYDPAGGTVEVTAQDGVTKATYRLYFKEPDVSALPSIEGDKLQPIKAESAEGDPQATLDGNSETVWNGTANNASIVYDLGSIHDLEGIEVEWATGAAQRNNFRVDVSIDGVNWWNVADLQSINSATELRQRYSFQDVSFQFPDVFGQYVKVQRTGGFNGIRELQLFGRADTASPPIPSEPPSVDGNTITLGVAKPDGTGRAVADVPFESIEAASANAAGLEEHSIVIRTNADDDAEYIVLRMPAQALSEAYKSGAQTLDMTIGSMRIAVDFKSLKPHLTEGASTIEILAGIVPASDLPDAASAAVGDGSVVELGMTVDGEAVERLGGWPPLRVELLYAMPAGGSGDETIVYHIDERGKRFVIPWANYDPNSKKIVFDTKRFGFYSPMQTNRQLPSN